MAKKIAENIIDVLQNNTGQMGGNGTQLRHVCHTQLQAWKEEIHVNKELVRTVLVVTQHEYFSF